MNIKVSSFALALALGLALTNVSATTTTTSSSTNATSTAAAPAPSTKPVAFKGTVSAVDLTANTITVATKTETRIFNVTPTTKVISGDGKPSTLSTATVGEAVSGSFITDATGKLNLHKLRIGAKVKPTATAPASTSTNAAPMVH